MFFDETRANDKDYVLAAVSQNGYALQYASSEIGIRLEPYIRNLAGVRLFIYVMLFDKCVTLCDNKYEPKGGWKNE